MSAFLSSFSYLFDLRSISVLYRLYLHPSCVWKSIIYIISYTKFEPFSFASNTLKSNRSELAKKSKVDMKLYVFKAEENSFQLYWCTYLSHPKSRNSRVLPGSVCSSFDMIFGWRDLSQSQVKRRLKTRKQRVCGWPSFGCSFWSWRPYLYSLSLQSLKEHCPFLFARLPELSLLHYQIIPIVLCNQSISFSISRGVLEKKLRNLDAFFKATWNY